MTTTAKRILILMLVFGAAVLSGWAATRYIEHRAPPTSAVPVWSATSPGEPLRVALVLGSIAHDTAQGQIALPHDSRFNIRVASDLAGEVRVYSIDPHGIGNLTPLWAGRVAAGGTTDSPGLRLAGAGGLETLRLVLSPADGSAPVAREVHLWHQGG